MDSKDSNEPEQVELVVDKVDDPSIPVWTFRMWTIGLFSCILLSCVNQFFEYRTEPLVITVISAQIVALPIGRFMAAVLPATTYRLPLTSFTFTLNPGPFNKKEHVLISIFANAGASFGSGNAYAVLIVTIVKRFYKRDISFHAGLLLVLTTQVLGYGWAGLLRKYLVEPASMWWPANLVQVSLFRTLHEKESKKGMSRMKFFLIALIASFAYYLLPGYFFGTLTSVSWLCWAFPHSVLAQQLGSGQRGLGLGAFGLDWSTVSSFLGSPLVTPAFAIFNVLAGYTLFLYVLVPAFYWTNVYDAKKFPIFSSHLFANNGKTYKPNALVDEKFEFNEEAYKKFGPVNMSTLFAITYGMNFATVAALLTHVICFHGRDIWKRSRAAFKTESSDVHSQLMKNYPTIPNWWFVILMLVSLGVAMATVEVFKDQLQLPWWGVLFACAFAAAFTLPIGVIAATTNQFAGLNVITEYIVGYMLPGKPVANVCFKTYGYISMSQALSFLQDFKLGHYMKVPPRSMFVVQIIGTVVAGVANMGVAWYMLTNIKNICDTDLLPDNSPWTCPSENVFYTASVIWGVIGPKRMFSPSAKYSALSWFFLIGAVAPVLVWLLHKLLHKRYPQASSWLKLVNIPVITGALGAMPPATPVNYSSWIVVGIVFNYFVFKYRKSWWKRYNYVLSAALEAGVAFMAVLLYFSLQLQDKSVTWWGSGDEHCPLAHCPTQPGIVIPGCPVHPVQPVS